MKLKVTFYSDKLQSKKETALIDVSDLKSSAVTPILKMIVCLAGRDDIDRQVTKMVGYLTGRYCTQPSYTFSGSNNFVRVERVYEKQAAS